MAQQKRTNPGYTAPYRTPKKTLLAPGESTPLRTGPLLTLYPSGLANLNGNASRLLPKGTDCFLLLPPTLTRPRWAMLAGPSALAGDIKLAGRSDRPGALRFRAPELALSLFAALPAEQTALRLRLEPEVARLDLFQLLPVL
jgi:hypothetical protein